MNNNKNANTNMPQQKSLAKPNPTTRIAAEVQRRAQMYTSLLRPSGMDLAVFQAKVIREIANNEGLLDCLTTEKGIRSIMLGVHLAAGLGLEIGGTQGHCYLVKFSIKDVAQAKFIMGYKGLRELARRSGRVGGVRCEVVYDGDEYWYRPAEDRPIHHVPCPNNARDSGIVAAWARVEIFGSEPQWAWVWRHEYDKRARLSKSSAHDSWRPEMIKKTALRRALENCPQSTNMRDIQLVARAEIAADQNRPLDIGDITDDPEVLHLAEGSTPSTNSAVNNILDQEPVEVDRGDNPDNY